MFVLDCFYLGQSIGWVNGDNHAGHLAKQSIKTPVKQRQASFSNMRLLTANGPKLNENFLVVVHLLNLVL